LTDYLIDLIDGCGLTAAPYGYAIGTPREAERRGGHVAVEHPEAARIAQALKARGIVPDFRPPNVVRLAPAPLSTTFHELWRTVQALREIVARGEHLAHANERGLVT
jgi:kynureninase